MTQGAGRVDERDLWRADLPEVLGQGRAARTRQMFGERQSPFEPGASRRKAAEGVRIDVFRVDGLGERPQGGLKLRQGIVAAAGRQKKLRRRDFARRHESLPPIVQEAVPARALSERFSARNPYPGL